MCCTGPRSLLFLEQKKEEELCRYYLLERLICVVVVEHITTLATSKEGPGFESIFESNHE